MIDVRVPDEQEGTKAVVRAWLKKVGETVAINDPLVELETDKVTQEVPSPAAGVLSRDFARFRCRGGTGRAARADRRWWFPGKAGAQPSPRAGNRRPKKRFARLGPCLRQGLSENPASPPRSVARSSSTVSIPPAFPAPGATGASPATMSIASSPTVVRSANRSPSQTATSRTTGCGSRSPRIWSRAVTDAPHVTALFEADFSAIAAHKTALAERGAKLSYTAYIVKAAAEAMAVAPAINGRWEEDRIAVSPTIDIGVGTALGDKGLVVPVVKDSGALTLEQIGADARRPHQPSARRRAQGRRRQRRKLHHFQPRRVGQPARGADHHPSGPGRDSRHRQARKAGRRARTCDGEDAMVIRPMAYVTLTIDHRVVDGHQTNAWLSRFVEILEIGPGARSGGQCRRQTSTGSRRWKWRTRQDSNLWPLPSEGSALSS